MVTARGRTSARPWALLAAALMGGAAPPFAGAQSRLKTMPGYARYVRMRREMAGAIKPGLQGAAWKDGGQSLEYTRDGKRYRYDIAARKEVEASAAPAPTTPPPPRGRSRQVAQGGFGQPARGRQFTVVPSPDGTHRAVYRNRNLWLTDADGKNETAITADGSEKTRVKYGTACWVYGEELDQRTAIWWSPDGQKLAFYRFDESKVPDYYLAMTQLQVQDTLDVEPFPKVGAPNPVVDLYVYDLKTQQTTHADVRGGQPFSDAVIGHYVYGVQWSPDGRELLFYRTNRRQNVLELAACDPQTGRCRAVFREEWPASWTENSPMVRFLKDGKRFILASDRTGWRNYYLYDLDGRLLATLTNHRFDVADLLRVDEDRGEIFYLARSGENPLKLQLHRTGLDGRGDRRLTDRFYHHTVEIAPDGRHFLDTYETHNSPPETRLADADGRTVATLARSDIGRFRALNLRAAELFQFKAADGKTDLYGMLYKPSDFDPHKTYPLLIGVYAGPETGGAQEQFGAPPAETELGFLVASLDSRSAAGRGKRSLDAIYGKLGITEIDDQAAGVRYLRTRPYVDGSRVGIHGASYGGYAAAMCLLRYPDVFQAACASSPVTDWRNYDSIYTERYMGLLDESRAAYDAGSAATYAKNLKGALMLYYGTADNNVHPAHSLQLIAALQREGKSFEVQVGPDRGHSGVSPERMMEFFIENLGRGDDRATR